MDFTMIVDDAAEEMHSDHKGWSILGLACQGLLLGPII